MSGKDDEWMVDVTELIVLDLRTGIQRVVQEIVHHAVASGRKVTPVIAVAGHFHRLNAAGLERMQRPSLGVAERRITHEKNVPAVIRLLKRGAKPFPGLYNALQRRWIGFLTGRRARGFFQPERIVWTGQSRLILIDSFWGGASTLRAARRARNAGARVMLVIYDLIPMTHPQFCDARLVSKFEPLMTEAIDLSQGVLAISDFCATSVRQAFSPAVPVRSFRLGHDLRGAATPVDPAVYPPKLWDGSGPVFVIVGSVEPRKGHRAVLDAFERRWAAGGREKLVILGKVGWDVDDLMRRIDRHPERDHRLFHLFGADDATLADVLRRADAAIIASHVEGFGLPLVEALAAGLPVIAADIPVFREIAEGAVRFFAVGDPDALAEALVEVGTSPAPWRERATKFAWPDWAAAAADFYAQADDLAGGQAASAQAVPLKRISA